MLLLIDAGNTRVKWATTGAVADDAAPLGQWSQSGSVAHAQLAQLADGWRAVRADRVIVSNVAGAVMRTQLEDLLSQALPTATVEWFASTDACAGVRNGYRQPQQLGCDRFASAIGAHAMFPQQALLVATCGTATTIDAISADGVFTGGMILPGLKLMAASLARNTAQLPEVSADGDHLPVFADNTEEAIVAGCIAAQAGAIERAYAAYRQAQADGDVRCLIAGGAGALLVHHLAIPCLHVDNLVLPGLQMAARCVNPMTPTTPPALC
jgi:type III pantothenate kinase